MNFDVIVIGAGPGGYVAAIRAAQLKMRVAVVERQHLGGICLNWGCIPTKALLRSAEVYRTMSNAKSYGLQCTKGFDIKAIIKRSRTISSSLNKGISHLLKKNNVTIFEGAASLSDTAGDVKRVFVEDKNKKKSVITAKNIIVATGARARILPGLEPDGTHVWSYREALSVDRLPDSLIVLGSGAIGVEFASFFSAFGCKVTIIEKQGTILPHEDGEISALAHKSFKRQGIHIITGSGIKSFKRETKRIEVTLDSGERHGANCLLLAVGIRGNVEGFGLENTSVKVHNTHIETDGFCETDARGIYAIGDVAGPPWLAHKAEHEAVICVEHIAGNQQGKPLNTKNIASCTYCHPQIASIGLTEAQAVKVGRKIRVGRFPFMANGKALALGEREGLLKTIFDANTGEILGAHMIGAEVTELIAQFSIARTLEATEQEIMHTVFPHPTLSEMTYESVLDAFGRAIHI